MDRDRGGYVIANGISSMLDPGDSAPPFSLANHEGVRVSPADLDATHVVVYFYPRADTPGCTTEACGFRDEWERFREADVDVVGISDDPVTDLDAFASAHDLPFQLLSDPDGEVAAAYDAYGEKQLFGRVVKGVFRNTYVLDSTGTVVLTYEGVSPADHAADVLEDIAALEE